jgi:tetratricopeptide (TPR) repeat protein
LAVTSAHALSCGLDALADKQDRIDAPTLKLYLNGCSRLASVYGAGTYDPNLATLFERVIAKAPHLNGAWARLFTTQFEGVRDPTAPAALRARLRRQIARAEQLGVDVGEAYAAKAALLPADDFAGILALYDKGIEADPDNAFLYRVRAEQWQGVGRMGDSITDADQALRLDPLSPALLDAHVSALAYAGKVETAFEQLRNAEAMWPKSENLQQARYRLDLRFGDPKEALALYRQTTPGTDPSQEYFILARINPTPANVDLAINRHRAIHTQYPYYIAGLIQALAEFGRKEEVLEILRTYSGGSRIGYNAEVLFRPAMREVWRDPRSIAAAAHLGLLKYWKSSGRWPDFCDDPTLPYKCRAEAAKYRI